MRGVCGGRVVGAGWVGGVCWGRGGCVVRVGCAVGARGVGVVRAGWELEGWGAVVGGGGRVACVVWE